MSYFTKEDIREHYYGHETITITEEDIQNLKKGVTLYTDIQSEYSLALEYGSDGTEEEEEE